jgi:PhnB protein
MMHISPHLTFDGQCRAAFQLYHRILGGTIATMLTYGESPMASQIDSRWHERIVHATLRLGDVELTGTDLLPHDYRRPEGFFVTLTLESATQAEDIFNALAEDGEVRLPFRPTFWSPGFGVLVDRFGVPWELNSAQGES